MKPLSGNKIKVIGVMSGTSLDGLDLLAVEFNKNNSWQFSIKTGATISYSEKWLRLLNSAQSFSALEITKLNIDYGRFIGEQVNAFARKNSFSADLISSHGHTVFHQPENGFTLQIGSGEQIAALTQTTTVCDFRTLDVALGGQGAPLVPVGDELLFPDYDYCLNLGGFSNISFRKKNKRLAFDICPVNIVLNQLAQKQNRAFDKNGELGKSGQVFNPLLNELNELGFYKQDAPKSLGREWVEQVFLPVLDNYSIAETDKIRTVYEHIAIQISKVGKTGKMLITGGGAFNGFLIERIKQHSKVQIEIPEKQLVEFKEALIFAFLGVLKISGQINTLASVTGASRDSSSGVVFQV